MNFNGGRQFGHRALTILRRTGLLIWRNQLKCRNPPRRKCRVRLRVRRIFSTLRPRKHAVPDLCHDWHSLASTGVRGLSTAETACFDRLTALTNRLQWGCGLSTAESGGRALLNSTSLGCNPVATQPQLTWAGSTLKPHSVHSGVPLVTDPFSQ